LKNPRAFREARRRTHAEGEELTTPFLVCAAITALSAFISLGFSLAAALSEAGVARTMAFYATARSVALAIASVVPFMTGSVGWLLAVGWIMIIVQALDAIVGVTINDKMKTFGPAATAVLNLFAVMWLIRGA
jgi:hypothetical protein